MRSLSAMNLLNLSLLSPNLLYAQEAVGEATATTPPPGGGLMGVLPLFAVVFFIFYFLVIRPQDKEQRAHQELLDSLKSGMQLLTTGGIIGKVVSFDDQGVVLEIANNVRVRFDRGAIVKVVEASQKEDSPKKNKKKAAS